MIDMPKYLMIDGAEFDANDPQDLLEQMRLSSFTASVDLEEFMKQTARRCYMYSGAWIRTVSVDIFVEDLIASKFLKVVE